MDEKYVISDCTYGQRKRFDEVIHTFECEGNGYTQGIPLPLQEPHTEAEGGGADAR